MKSAFLECGEDLRGEFGLSSGGHWLGLYLEIGVVGIASKGIVFECTISIDEAASESSTVLVDKASHGGRNSTSSFNPRFNELGPGRAMGDTFESALSFFTFISGLTCGFPGTFKGIVGLVQEHVARIDVEATFLLRIPIANRVNDDIGVLLAWLIRVCTTGLVDCFNCNRQLIILVVDLETISVQFCLGQALSHAVSWICRCNRSWKYWSHSAVRKCTK